MRTPASTDARERHLQPLPAARGLHALDAGNLDGDLRAGPASAFWNVGAFFFGEDKLANGLNPIFCFPCR